MAMIHERTLANLSTLTTLCANIEPEWKNFPR